MENFLRFGSYKFCLIGKINGLASESKKLRKRISKCVEEKFKNRLTLHKKFIGNEARHYLLAYAFLKGKTYLSVERKCSIKPNVELILEIIHSNVWSFQKSKITIQTIEKWLKGE